MGKTYRSCLLDTLAYIDQGLSPSCTKFFFLQTWAIVTYLFQNNKVKLNNFHKLSIYHMKVKATGQSHWFVV